MHTTILALDLGTTTGWALRDRTGRITSGSQSFVGPEEPLIASSHAACGAEGSC